MKRLPVWYKDKVVRYTKVDKKDLKDLSERTWCLTPLRGGYVRQSSQQALNRGESRYLHRVLLKAPSGWDVDHIDHNPLNNQRNNLRLLKRADNVRHRKGPSKNNTSGFLGVYYHTQSGLWVSAIEINKKKTAKSFKLKREAVLHASNLRAPLGLP